MRIPSARQYVMVVLIGVWPLIFLSGAFSAELSKDKENLWEMTQQNLKKEYGVCVEHCGNDAACREKCEKAYKSRMDNEYQKLIREGGGKSAPKDGC
jgi:hypothetical protein